MSRIPRIKGTYITYHIIIRGNGRKNIFVYDHDRNRFIDILRRTKEKCNFEVDA